tara:strand:- start:615 stop:1817 length:1203 start_codon:yes stop_codon:yes gene_type:complete
MENNHAGGMDSFLTNLTNKWPNSNDKIIVIINKSHPGNKILKKNIKRNIIFYEHSIPISWNITKKYFFLFPKTIVRVFNLFIKICLFPIQLNQFKKLFKSFNAERLLVINGAYPGGETCRIANIAWGKLGKRPSVHNIRNFAIKPKRLMFLFENFVDQSLIKYTSCFIGVSKVCANSLRVRTPFEDLNNIHHIYNGVETNFSESIEQHKLNIRSQLKIPNSKICLVLGTYEERKGHKFLFDAFDLVFSKDKNIHLVVCGDSIPSDKNRVKKLKDNKHSKNNIHLLDFVENGKYLINQADVLLVGSQEWESFGWTVIESMIRRVPVVSTDTGGLKEVIGESGISGYTHRSDDYVSFANSILDLLNNNNLRNEIINNAYQRVKINFNEIDMINKYYEKIIGN